ncbi:cytochrome C oxidase subunit IV family protein [Coraliomargarita parva]|uniref:cytochrome C oxidase subunit IV family protein n=1 Tax=Coraliomargarita parva TaxID=3014050 RepID=UPI0022B5260F|nr:cytochrome C oxidase subunit IV family protein [Coraliomargarita parva]
MSEAHYHPVPVADPHAGDENEKYHAFVNLALILAAVTGVELVLVYLPFAPAFVMSVLVALSLFKFLAVVSWFMHLIYDKLLLSLAFATGMSIAFGTFTALMFIMDTKYVAPPEIPGM